MFDDQMTDDQKLIADELGLCGPLVNTEIYLPWEIEENA